MEMRRWLCDFTVCAELSGSDNNAMQIEQLSRT